MDPDFGQRCYIPGGPDALVSFDLARFVLFVLLVVIIGPILFRSAAWLYDWERDPKSLVNHFHDTVEGIGYSFVVFTLGNYAHTLSWWTVGGYFAALLGWSMLGELSFMKVSLPTWRTWTKGAWIVNGGIVAVVLSLAVVHFGWAQATGILWPWYIGGLVVAVTFLVSGASVSVYEQRVVIPRLLRSGNTVDVDVTTATRSDDVEDDWEAEPLVVGNGPTTPSDRPSEPIHGLWRRVDPISRYHQRRQGDPPHPRLIRRYRIHLHHWQIFYVLAFFTRFVNPISQVCSGLVLGIFMHGGAAYGFHPMLEVEQEEVCEDTPHMDGPTPPSPPPQLVSPASPLCNNPT